MATGNPQAAGAERPAGGGGGREPSPALAAAAGGVESAAPDGFELLVEREPPGLVRRFFTTHRHFLGLLIGGLAAHLRELPTRRPAGSPRTRSAACAAPCSAASCCSRRRSSPASTWPGCGRSRWSSSSPA